MGSVGTGPEPGSLQDGRELHPTSAVRPLSPTGEVDQVDLARDWLRGHGVEAPDVERPSTGRTVTAQRAITARRAVTGSRPADDVAARAPRADADQDHAEGDAQDDGEGSGSTRTRRSSRRGRGRSSGPAEPRGQGAGRAIDPDADPEEVARTIVLRKLAAQARTRAELERALQARAVPEEAANAVLDRMSEVGLVDDATFAHDWVASRQQRRHLSRTALRRELTTKGVDREVIDEALVGVDGSDEHSAALALAQRRVGPMAGLPREVAYRRLGGMLARRGFSGSVTTQVLGEVLDGWTEG